MARRHRAGFRPDTSRRQRRGRSPAAGRGRRAGPPDPDWGERATDDRSGRVPPALYRKPRKILVVDDEPVVRESLAAWLVEDGNVVTTAASGAEAVARCREGRFDVSLVDLKMPPGMDGLETMRAIRALDPDAPVVIVTAYATVDTAVQAMREGAADYIVKPFDLKDISALVERIARLGSLRSADRRDGARRRAKGAFHGIISRNARMHAIFDLVRAVAGLRSTVLIEGESGTGKELIARAVHAEGDRAERAFVTVSCAALAETLLESELFGHEKGSFTGAASRKRGKFEVADGGTIFLDEIGDISPKLQADLLRVLQERCFFRVGGVEEIRVDVRVIAATNARLGELVQGGRFREDLYYRLNVINVKMPPLRERRDDILLLARHFLGVLSGELHKDVTGFSRAAARALVEHDWPGNVRELQNALERAVVTCKGPTVEERDLAFLGADRFGRIEPGPGPTTLRDIERRAVAAALAATRGNISAAAVALGIDRSTLYEKMRRHGLRRRATNDPPGRREPLQMAVTRAEAQVEADRGQQRQPARQGCGPEEDVGGGHEEDV